MLVVRVEVWPGGDLTRVREIGRAGLANVSNLADISDYVGVLTDDRGIQQPVMVRSHARAAGFWPLLARACAVESDHAVPDELLHVTSAVAERLLKRP
jgi:hypothetical protein